MYSLLIKIQIHLTATSSRGKPDVLEKVGLWSCTHKHTFPLQRGCSSIEVNRTTHGPKVKTIKQLPDLDLRELDNDSAKHFSLCLRLSLFSKAFKYMHNWVYCWTGAIIPSHNQGQWIACQTKAIYWGKAATEISGLLVTFLSVCFCLFGGGLSVVLKHKKKVNNKRETATRQ